MANRGGRLAWPGKVVTWEDAAMVGEKASVYIRTKVSVKLHFE